MAPTPKAVFLHQNPRYPWPPRPGTFESTPSVAYHYRGCRSKYECRAARLTSAKSVWSLALLRITSRPTKGPNSRSRAWQRGRLRVETGTIEVGGTGCILDMIEIMPLGVCEVGLNPCELHLGSLANRRHGRDHIRTSGTGLRPCVNAATETNTTQEIK